MMRPGKIENEVRFAIQCWCCAYGAFRHASVSPEETLCEDGVGAIPASSTWAEIQGAAADSFRQAGWRETDGLWCCPEHAA